MIVAVVPRRPARRLRTLLGLGCVLVGASAGAAQPARHLLAGYSFDDSVPAVGPDTFQVFRNGRGEVTLNGDYRYSGYRSVRIQDVAGDGDFPELQGYFKAPLGGTLHFHFALMLTDTGEPLNIALAGKKHFGVKKHGIGFWLDAGGGMLRHYSDRQWRPLFEVSPFAWYVVDVVYDIKRGVYDLRIRDEYGNRLVKLEKQSNAAGRRGSTVDKFSFIGDLDDRGNVQYFVDDVMLYTNDKTQKGDFVAPGRRKLFVDAWNDYHRTLYGSTQCLPAVDSRDLGIAMDVYLDIVEEGYAESFNRLLNDKAAELPAEGRWRSNRFLQALARWRRGCEALKNGDAGRAVDEFDSASTLVPEARMYPLSLALAYAADKRDRRADTLFATVQADWIGDQRYAVAQAMAAMQRGEPESVLERLQRPARDGLDAKVLNRLSAVSLNRNMIAELKSYEPERWRAYIEQVVIREQYYFALLWLNNYNEAASYADDMAARLERHAVASAKWLERAGDAAFYNGRYDHALSRYRRALDQEIHCRCIYLKLSDVYHLTGDPVRERRYREAVYGHLREADGGTAVLFEGL